MVERGGSRQTADRWSWFVLLVNLDSVRFVAEPWPFFNRSGQSLAQVTACSAAVPLQFRLR
jgi:hypothetical protein